MAASLAISSTPIAPAGQAADVHPPACLQLDNVHVHYRSHGRWVHAVDGVDMHLHNGQIGCLLGASGCGKTTLLRALAGFERLQQGAICVNGVKVADLRLHSPPESRNIGMMFQDYALFPHLSVAANVGFGLHRLPRQQRHKQVMQMLEMVGLEQLGQRYPHQLSGGQQQRVALARALAPQPALLLLDEPFSNLDVDTRQQLASELRDLLKQTATTVLMVTHDQGEAFAMADVIGVMARGRILQWGDANSLYHRPASIEVANFIGRGTVVLARTLGLDEDAHVLLRPEHIRLHNTASAADALQIQAQLRALSFRGPGLVAAVQLANGAVLELDLPQDAWQIGQALTLFIPAPAQLVRFSL